METTIIALVVAIVKSLIKNPAKKAKLKKVLLALRDSVSAAYGDE